MRLLELTSWCWYPRSFRRETCRVGTQKSKEGPLKGQLQAGANISEEANETVLGAWETNCCCHDTDMNRKQKQKEQVPFPASSFSFCLLCPQFDREPDGKEKCGLQSFSPRIIQKSREGWA